MAKVRFKKNVNIGRVVAKLVSTILGLWIGGIVITTLGEVLLHTESAFYKGLSLIGWTIGEYPLYNSSHHAVDCANTSVGVASANVVGQNCITNTSGSGVLAVIGLIGIAAIVLEFVEFNL